MNAGPSKLAPRPPPSGRRRTVRVVLALAFLFGLGGLIIWRFVEGRGEAAREAQREQPIKAPLRVSTGFSGEPLITLDAETEQRSGIETATLESAPYQQEVRAYGTVLELARLTDLSNSYANVKAQAQVAEAKLANSKMAFERAQKLYKDQQNVSLAQLQTAEVAFRTDEAGVAAAQSQLRTLVATVRQEWGPVLGKSLIDGSSLVTQLVERQDFLLQITLPPGILLATPPTTAAMQTGERLRATITFVSTAPRTDPKIQGVSLFYLASADSGVLPGMNVLAFLPSGPSVDGVTVPSAAIVWWQDRAWVYRRAGANAFTRAEIPTDLSAPGGGYVIRDFPKNSEIVTRGAQLLLSEEFRAQIQVGEDHK